MSAYILLMTGYNANILKVNSIPAWVVTAVSSSGNSLHVLPCLHVCTGSLWVLRFPPRVQEKIAHAKLKIYDFMQPFLAQLGTG